jgi:hypothetical protein
MKRLFTLLTALLLGAIGLSATLAGPAAAASSTASVYVVHGIPNTPVNVFVNGKSTLADFKPGTVAGPLQLAPGSYKVTVFPAADTAGTGTPVISATASVTAGESVSLVANLTAAGKPTLTPFVNDLSPMPAGMARLIVRHTAAAPAVDVRANGTPAFKGLTNPNQASADLPPGTINADVTLAGTSTVVIGPAKVTLTEGVDTIVYAIGSASGKTLGLVVQTISGLSSAPGGVPAGSGGLAATNHASVPVWVWVVSASSLLLALGGVTGVRRTRASR